MKSTATLSTVAAVALLAWTLLAQTQIRDNGRSIVVKPSRLQSKRTSPEAGAWKIPGFHSCPHTTRRFDLRDHPMTICLKVLATLAALVWTLGSSSTVACA